MISFWSLLTMHSKHRHYALLDQSGICLAFRHCCTPPAGNGWVEIDEPCLSWLHRPLPDRAAVTQRDQHSERRHPLAN